MAIPFLAPMAAKIAGTAFMKSPIGGFLKRHWKLILLVIVIGIVIWRALAWHAGKVEAFGDERFKAGYEQARTDAKAAQVEVDNRGAEIAAEERRKHDEEDRRIATAYDALRLRGAGKAACTNSAFLPAASGGHDQAGGSADGAVADLHNQQWQPLVGLPLAPTLDFGEQHDSFRNEALSWRSWHFRFTVLWAEYQRKVEEHAAKASGGE